MSADLFPAVLACIKGGVSVIPIDKATKRPALKTWKPYQSSIVDEKQARRWFKPGVEAFAVVCGEVSGGLLVLDFDCPRFYAAWRSIVGEQANGLPVQRTGGGGFQVLLRCPNPGGNDKLAWAKDDAGETARTIAIETRGEGGYAVAAPSVHPAGTRYQWLTGDAASIPVVPQARADALLDAARKLDEMPLTRQEQERLESHAREAHSRGQAGRNGQASVIDAFNAAHAIDAILNRHGYSQGTHGRYIRPGGDSESVSVKDGRSCHWSSDDPLNDGGGKGGCGCHYAFDLYAHFEHGGDSKAAVKAAAELLRINPASKATPLHDPEPREVWPDPLPLPAGLPPVMAFDFDLLPESFHAWVRDISDRMQCPADYCAATAMIVAGTLIGRKVAIRPKQYDDWQVVPNLFGVLVGRPSLLKSPAMKEVMRPLLRLEVEAKTQYCKLVAEQAASTLVADAKKKVAKKDIKKAIKAGGDAQAIAQSMAGDKEELPVRQRYITNDTTVEKLGVILSENPNGVLVFLDELISLLRSMEREGHESDRGFYLTAWNGDSRFTYDRIGRGTLDIEAAIVSIVGSIQPGVIADYLRGAVTGGGNDDGLMQRFQRAVWPDVPGKWINVDRYPDAKAKSAALEAFQHLADLTADSVDAQRDNLDSAAVPFLRFDAAAQEVFNEWREVLESRIRSDTEHPAIEAHLAKYRSLIPSLALILHLLDGGVGSVPQTAAEKAIGWGQYLESHARRLYAGVTESPAVAARLLAGKIEAGEVANHFAARDVYRHAWAGLDRDRTEAAIDVLTSLHWLEERIEPTAGKSRTRYAINPKVRIIPKTELTKLPKDASVSFVSTVPEDISISGAIDNRERGEL